MFHALFRRLQELDGRGQLGRLGAQQGLEQIRRQRRLRPLFQQGRGEMVVIVVDDGVIQRMARVARLDQHLTDAAAFRLRGPPGPARHLHELGEQPFAGPVILRKQGRVRIQNADQRQLFEIVALGHHLRADQDIHFAAVHAVERFLRAALLARGIGIDAQNPRLGKQLLQALFQALRAASQRLQVDVAARGAMAGNA